MNFKNAPYFDDFTPDNNFYRVLFKPGYAVQARELNQLQSILQHQVTTVGNHLFKKNSMVIPGGVFLNTAADIITITSSSGEVFTNAASLVGKIITNAPVASIDPSNRATTQNYITAQVVAAREAVVAANPQDTIPAALFVMYKQSQDETSGGQTVSRREFDSLKDAAGISTYEINPVTFKVVKTLVGKVATTAPGTYFTKDIFVDTTKTQHAFIELDNQVVTNCTVGFKVVESIVTSDDDESLNDNATGYPNYYAPGADRYKIDLVLVRKDSSEMIDVDNFIKMMVIENNSVVYLNDRTEYNELLKTLARRTYDANGNFVVEGLKTTVTDTASEEYIQLNLSRGKSYIGGYEYDQITDTKVQLKKPRDPEYISASITKSTTDANCMTYFYVGDKNFVTDSNIKVGANLITDMTDANCLVQLVSGRLPSSSGYIIGYAILRGIEYAFSSDDNTTVYKAYLDDVSFNPGYSASDVSAIQSPSLLNISARSQVGPYFDAPVLHEYTLTNIINNNVSTSALAAFNVGDLIVPGSAANDTQSVGRVFTTTGNKLYVTKESNKPIPPVGSIKQYTGILLGSTSIFTGASGTRAATGATGYRNLTALSTTSVFGQGAYFNIDLGTTTGATGYGATGVIQRIWASAGGRGYATGDKITIAGNKLGQVLNTNNLTFTLSYPAGYGASATATSVFSSNYSATIVPMIEVDTDIINTVSNIQYYTLHYGQYTFGSYSPGTSVNSSSSPIVLASDSAFTDFIKNNYVAYYTVKTADDNYASEDRFVQLNTPTYDPDVTFNYETNSYYFNLSNTTTIGRQISNLAGPFDVTIHLYSIVKVVGSASNVTKNITGSTGADVITTPSQTWMALTNQDISTVDKIVEGKTIPVSTATWSSNTVTITGATGHGITVGTSCTIVVKNVVSQSNASGAFNVGYNGVFTANAATDTTLTYTRTTNPGTITQPASVNAIIALPPDLSNTSTDTDITTRYNVYNGNTAYLTGTGLIKLKGNALPPSGQIGVKYTYFSMLSTGHFACVNSYGTDNISKIADTYDHANNKVETRRYLDFRIRPSKYFFKNIGSVSSTTLTLVDLNLCSLASGLVGKYVVGPGCEQGVQISSVSNGVITLATAATRTASGTYYIGLDLDSVSKDLKVADSSGGGNALTFPLFGSGKVINVTYKKYLPRRVLMLIDRANDNTLNNFSIKYQDVNAGATSALNLNQFRQDVFRLPIAYVDMPPYTLKSSDVTVTQIDNPVYKMPDIHDLKKRIERDEYYITLALANNGDPENTDSNDPAFKQDLWVETFDNLERQETTDSDFKCTVYEGSYAAPKVATRVVMLDLYTADSEFYQRTGKTITLPYTESKALGNTLASSGAEVNPFDPTPWTGKVELNPAVDNWNDIPDDCRPRGPEVVTKVDVSNIPRGCSKKNATVPNKHSIEFNWETSWGRKGRVNTDRHLSKVIRELGDSGTDGSYARSLVGKYYSDTRVKAYLNAGHHFDLKPMHDWDS